MGLLDWLTDGTLGNMGGISGGETGSPPPMNMPQPAMQPPPVQQTGSDGLPIAPPPQPNPGAMAPPVDPSTQAIGGGTGAGPAAPTPDPTPAAGPPDPPIPMPAPRPPGADAPQPLQPSSLPPPGNGTGGVGPGLGVAGPPIPPPGTPMAAPGIPGGGPAPTAYKLGDQTALGRALGIDPKSQTFNTSLAGFGAGLTAAGNSKGKSAGQALASGAGGAIEGSAKEEHAANKDATAYLNAAINAKKENNDAAYKTNYTQYLAAKLKSEQDAAASKDKAVANKNDSPTQLYLAAQRNVAADPLVKGSLTAYQAAIKDGDPTKVATAKAAYEQTVQERQAAHLAGVGLHPQTAAQIAAQPGMSKENPVNGRAAGITPDNITTKLFPGQYYTNPSNGQLFVYKGEPTKATSSKSTPSSKPEPDDPLKPDKVPASAGADDKDDD